MAMVILQLPFARALAGKIIWQRILAFLILFVAAAGHAGEIRPYTGSDTEEDGRAYTWLSIHPDGNRWLITECMEKDGARSCFPFLYDFRTGRYQRYALPPGYFYMNARFSPSGNVIVAERNPVPVDFSANEKRQLMSETEVIRMNIDGADFQVLPVPKGFLTYPVMSPDETKVAYWSAVTAPNEKELRQIPMTELHEFDLTTKVDRLFAGPFQFQLSGNLQYRTNDEIAVQMFGASARPPKILNGEKLHLVEVVSIKRNSTTLPEPLTARAAIYTSAILDKKQRVHILMQEKSRAFMMIKIDAQGETYLWKSPPYPLGGPIVTSVSHDGRFTGFIYMTNPILTADMKNRLGVFCSCDGGWYSVRLPHFESAETIEVR